MGRPCIIMLEKNIVLEASVFLVTLTYIIIRVITYAGTNICDKIIISNINIWYKWLETLNVLLYVISYVEYQ